MSNGDQASKGASYLKTTVQGENPDETPDPTEVQTLTPLPGLSHEEFEKLARSVLVVVPFRANEGINEGICKHFGMWGRIGLRVGTVKDPNGGFLEVQRGGIVQLFLEYAHQLPEIRYLVMIDNDEVINWDAPLRLAQHGLPIVSGVVCSYSPERGIFACFTAADENGIHRFPSIRDTMKIPADGIIEAGQVGTGLICIRRDVLETIKQMDEEPFFIPEDIRREGVRGGTVKKGEDIVFCERASKYGFKCYVDFSVHASHYKTLAIGWPEESIDETIDAIDWKPSPFDYKGVL